MVGGIVFASFGFDMAFAQTNGLIVEFENDPLFSQTNFLPGESIARWVKVDNNSGQEQPISVEAINVSDSDDFGDVINLQIKEGGSVLFDDTMAQFFHSGQIFLSNVPDADNTQYDFIATFLPESGNDYQGVGLGFDIIVGFKGTEDISGGTTSGGTGGGSTALSGLSIYSETVEVIDAQTTSVTITWSTSYMSTSQVIYAIAGTVYTFDLNAEKFGYPFASPTPEDFNMVTFHTVTVDGLTPGTTYNFRCVSHASPPTISREFSFATLALVEGEQESPIRPIVTPTTPSEEAGGEGLPPTGTGEAILPGTAGGVSGETPEAGPGVPESAIEPGTEETPGGEVNFGANMLAAIGNIMDSKFLFAICLFLLIVLLGLIIKEVRYQYLEYKRKKNQDKLF